MQNIKEHIATKLVPQLRFKEFDGEWTKKDFGTIVEKAKAKHDPQKSKEEYPCIEMESIAKESSILLEVFNSKDQLSIKNKFNRGEVLFGKLRPNLKKYVIAPFDGVCSSEIWVLKGKELSNEFLFRLIQTNKFYSSTLVTSGSKMPRADWAYISSSIFPFPSLPEQQKVAFFLSAVDKKIQQLTKKMALLEQYKKGVMQQLFSGQHRFKDENRNTYPDWEGKRLGDYLDLYSERVSATTNFPVLTSSRTGLKLQSEYFDNRELSNEGEYGVVPKGYFVYRYMSDDSTFKFNINSIWDKGAVSKEYPVFTTVGMSSKYLNYVLNEGNEIKKFAIIQKKGGTRVRLYFKTLCTLELNIPSLAEQQKIATYLSSIDTKIEAVNNQIAQTQTFKKGLLQQMFV
jgi:type I restriction enzyme S subunit